MQEKATTLFFSVIIPVYNRPEEVQELLESLVQQSNTNFEVLLIEDGSDERCEDVAAQFNDQLKLRYVYKENSGQGFSRNVGFEKAKGDYFVVFDSDCIIPPHYFETVQEQIRAHGYDAYGGPDKAHASFTKLQKAISYSMTSPFTTGGIRGNEKHAGSYHPRSFNMGLSREVYEDTSGFKITRMGEDIEFSIRIIAHGFDVGLIPEAYVYHKRRTTLSDFYRQLRFFGRARINIGRFYPDEIKAVHLLPTFFLLMIGFYCTLPFWAPALFMLLTGGGFLFFGALALHSTVKNKSLSVGLLSIVTSIVQLTAYGWGFLKEAARGSEK